MARSSRTKRRRVAPRNSNRRLPVSLISPIPYNSPLTLFEDRRQWSPLGSNRPARSFSRANHSLRVPKQVTRRSRPFRPSAVYPSASIGFDTPNRVLICVRRQQRREIMFARKKAGRRGQKSPKYNLFSKISCRR